MKREEKKPSVDQLNQFIQIVFSLVWMSPLAMFWLSAFGPLKPFHYEQIDTAPSLGWVLILVLMSGMVYFLPRSYYTLRKYERSGKRYEALGMRYFKQYVSNGDLMNRWIRRNDPTYRLIKGPASLRSFIDQTYTAEKIHLFFGVIGLITAGYAFQISWYGWFAYVFVANLLFNLYPILLQRYLRARIGRLHPGLTGSRERH
jgi:hypothetical protein